MSHCNDISLNSYFCPNCCIASFGQHPEQKYRDYNKCSFCGYMELTSQTLERITCKVTNDRECACKFICQKTINAEQIHKDDKTNNSTTDSSNN